MSGKIWEDNVDQFIHLAAQHNVKMLMVGGGAVNFHGYQRHSADVDFWIDTRDENMQKLQKVFKEMGFGIDAFPDEVISQKQNISIKFSPIDLNVELITRFEIGKSFDEAYKDSILVELEGKPIRKWRVLSYDDLIKSKEIAARPKDLLDIQELKRLKSK